METYDVISSRSQKVFSKRFVVIVAIVIWYHRISRQLSFWFDKKKWDFIHLQIWIGDEWMIGLLCSFLFTFSTHLFILDGFIFELRRLLWLLFFESSFFLLLLFEDGSFLLLSLWCGFFGDLVLICSFAYIWRFSLNRFYFKHNLMLSGMLLSIKFHCLSMVVVLIWNFKTWTICQFVFETFLWQTLDYFCVKRDFVLNGWKKLVENGSDKKSLKKIWKNMERHLPNKLRKNHTKLTQKWLKTLPKMTQNITQKMARKMIQKWPEKMIQKITYEFTQKWSKKISKKLNYKGNLKKTWKTPNFFFIR